jgi:hypothetical protein
LAKGAEPRAHERRRPLEGASREHEVVDRLTRSIGGFISERYGPWRL